MQVHIGSIRRNWTTGERVGNGNELSMDLDPGAGVAPILSLPRLKVDLRKQ